MSNTPQLHDTSFFNIDETQPFSAIRSSHAPRILILYGSLCERSYSRIAAEEAARILERLGAEVKLFDLRDLPQPDGAPVEHPKVAELRNLVTWCEGMVWCSPECHGAMTGITKPQIDWFPLSLGGVRPTQGKTLAVMQVCGGPRSFNTVNQLRILGRWMRLLTTPTSPRSLRHGTSSTNTVG